MVRSGLGGEVEQLENKLLFKNRIRETIEEKIRKLYVELDEKNITESEYDEKIGKIKGLDLAVNIIIFAK